MSRREEAAYRKHLTPTGPSLTACPSAEAVACHACGRRTLQQRLVTRLHVCERCGHHGQVPAATRMSQLADPGSLGKLSSIPPDGDIPAIYDRDSYRQKLVDARSATSADEAMLVARGTILGHDVVLACMDFTYFGGSLGSTAGGRFVDACDIAAQEHRALIAVCTSGGARMQEGIASLSQMARCTAGVSSVTEARVPYFAILVDPCFGGVTASFATQADVILAEPGARIGFAGARVIEQVTHQVLPPEFQRAEFLLAHGMIDAVVPRAELRAALAELLLAFSLPLSDGTAPRVACSC